MKVFAVVVLGSLGAASSSQMLDRTVAVVGSRAVTATETELQLRLQALFNGAPLDLSDRARQAALDRLIEQRLIETDMALAGVGLVEDRELEQAFRELRQSPFGGLAFDAALERYGVSEDDVREFLRRQLRFARYVELRFRAGLQADDEEIQDAYNRRFEGVSAPPELDDGLRAELRRQILDEEAERMLDERIRQLRAETRVAFLDPIQPEDAP